VLVVVAAAANTAGLSTRWMEWNIAFFKFDSTQMEQQKLPFSSLGWYNFWHLFNYFFWQSNNFWFFHLRSFCAVLLKDKFLKTFIITKWKRRIPIPIMLSMADNNNIHSDSIQLTSENVSQIESRKEASKTSRKALVVVIIVEHVLAIEVLNENPFSPLQAIHFHCHQVESSRTALAKGVRDWNWFQGSRISRNKQTPPTFVIRLPSSIARERKAFHA